MENRTIGNVPLYLLDTNIEGTNHGWITRRLYYGDGDERVAVEMVLGIGGVKALRALGIKPDIYHFNEGHAAFGGLELIREKLKRGLTFYDAWEEARQQIVFTTILGYGGNEEHTHDTLEDGYITD